MKQIMIALVLTILWRGLFALEADDERYPLKVMPLPSIGFSPETDLLFGAAVLGQFKLAGSDEETRSSNVIAFASYTLNKQYQIKAEYTIFLPQEKYMWTGEIDFVHFPENFWGIGPCTTDEDEVWVDRTNILFSQNLYKKFGNHFFSGIKVHYIHQFDVSFKSLDGLPVSYTEIPGNEGHTGLALGLGLIFDKRNSILTPTRGTFYEIVFSSQHKKLGSTYSFSTIETDVRQYLPLYTDDTTVLAMQLKTVYTTGVVPFSEMPLIGGRLMMRGIYEGRYRDKSLISMQAEVRQHLIKRIGFVLFGAGGNVGETLIDTFDTKWKWTTGGGLRFNISKEEKTNLRLDFGLGKNSSGMYITFGEAF